MQGGMADSSVQHFVADDDNKDTHALLTRYDVIMLYFQSYGPPVKVSHIVSAGN